MQEILVIHRSRMSLNWPLRTLCNKVLGCGLHHRGQFLTVYVLSSGTIKYIASTAAMNSEEFPELVILEEELHCLTP